MPSFYTDFFISPEPRAHPTQGHGEQAKVNRLLPRQNSINWLFSNFPKSSAHSSGAWRHSHPQVLSGIFILTSLNDTSPPRARTPALTLHPTNPCAKRKVPSPTKPKGKIYKTKSLGHYITHTHTHTHTYIYIYIYIYIPYIKIYLCFFCLSPYLYVFISTNLCLFISIFVRSNLSTYQFISVHIYLTWAKQRSSYFT